MTQVFNVPQYYGHQFVVGPQPFSPGEPNSSFPAIEMPAKPWPLSTPVLNLLIGNPGVARGYPIQKQITGVAMLPTDDLYMSGFVGKSLG
jgi:hypothetical protein